MSSFSLPRKWFIKDDRQAFIGEPVIGDHRMYVRVTVP